MQLDKCALLSSAVRCSASNLSAIQQRATMLQVQCQEYLKKAEFALQSVSHDPFLAFAVSKIQLFISEAPLLLEKE